MFFILSPGCSLEAMIYDPLMDRKGCLFPVRISQPCPIVNRGITKTGDNSDAAKNEHFTRHSIRSTGGSGSSDAECGWKDD
jgi:hypothetical protein